MTAPIALTVFVIGLMVFCGLSGMVINRRNDDGS